MADLPKVYDPQEVEDRLYRFWEEGGYFGAEPHPEKTPFTIVMPPPNITGALHLGHGLDMTPQDILVRWRRMAGDEALWVPGTDHAGIATQNVVERELAKEGVTRQDLGREGFVARVWEWREQYGTRIIGQLKRLGCSCDWGRVRFTMDPGLSRAVRTVFVDLFDEGLIYRGNRIINWCPRCGTAIADVELDHSDYDGELVEFRYPLEGGGHVTVATTRLETMLGDVAIAVNPADERYRGLVGRMAIHPFDQRRLPIVADEAVDPAFGTGAVKVTPAHDQTDFEIAERHDLPSINIFDTRARVNEHGGRFAGMDRYDAREAVRSALAELGLLVSTTPHRYAIARCSRCNTIIEPWLSEQWFVRMEPLARPAIEAVTAGRTRFYPERWTKYYLNWMGQIRDWCISRQLWWGHRIPVFYCDACGDAWAAMEDPTHCRTCGAGTPRQDPDVLDTWFSSQLWPFSTLGWPDATPDLDYFYPTSVLVTGYEIIHLWVARMIMSGLHFMGDVPFRWVFVHGIVRDAQGRKMSKSLGNVIDPLDIMDRYGTDALRFMLAEHATGQDIFLHEEWTAGARNFANKLWNASRFVIMNLHDTPGGSLEAPGAAPTEDLSTADRWILSRLAATIDEVTAALEGFEISVAAKSLYAFVWSEFCDWYLEVAKLALREEGSRQQAAARRVLRFVLEATVRLLHPFMPFITEEIWQRMPGGDRRAEPSIMRAPWPAALPGLRNAGAEEDFDRVRDVVAAIRSFVADHHVQADAKIRVHLSAGEPHVVRSLGRQQATIASLGRVQEVSLQAVAANNGPATRLVAGPVDIVIPLEGVLDLDAERQRLGRALEKVRADLERLGAKLANEQFRSRAPAEVVEGEEHKLEEARTTEAKLEAQLREIGG